MADTDIRPYPADQLTYLHDTRRYNDVTNVTILLYCFGTVTTSKQRGLVSAGYL